MKYNYNGILDVFVENNQQKSRRSKKQIINSDHSWKQK